MSGPFADEQLAAWVRDLPRSSPGGFDVTAMRAGSAERVRRRARGPEMDTVRELRIDGLAARLYRPAPGPLPVVLHLHGGGWTIGSLETHDRICRGLAVGSGAAVLALDYRLAPEHPWPASVDDSVAALRRLTSRPAELGETTGAFAVCGDSAGGALATLACLRLRDSEPAALPHLQVLVNANTDLVCDRPSMQEKASGWGLDADPPICTASRPR